MTFDDDPYDPFEFFTPREKKLHKLAGYLMYVGLGVCLLRINCSRLQFVHKRLLGGQHV